MSDRMVSFDQHGTSEASFSAAGRMALSNYLTQSIILAFIFYGYGLGLFGRLDPTSASILGFGLYTSNSGSASDG